jgi:hypothetical protein
MAAEKPQIPDLAHRLDRDIRNIIRIGQSGIAGVEETGKLVSLEAGQFDIEAEALQFAEFERQCLQVPAGVQRQLVVGEARAVENARGLTKRIEGLVTDADPTVACVALSKVLAGRLAKANDPSGKLAWATEMLAEMMEAAEV